MWLRILYTCGKLVAIAHISTVWMFICVVVKNESDGARVPSRTDSAGSLGIDDYQETCHHVSQDISGHGLKTVTDWCRYFLDTQGGKATLFWLWIFPGRSGRFSSDARASACSLRLIPLAELSDEVTSWPRPIAPQQSARGDGTGGWRWWRLTHMTDSYTNVREAQRDRAERQTTRWGNHTDTRPGENCGCKQSVLLTLDS